jgi:hypothetical protein
MRSWPTLLVVAALCATALPAHAAPDWSQFRPGPEIGTKEGLVAALHAFDPSLPVSVDDVREVAIGTPTSPSFTLHADLARGTFAVVPAMPGTQLAGAGAAGCLALGGGFGYVSSPPGIATAFFSSCAFGFHTNSVQSADLGCALTTFCYTFGINFGGSFGLVELLCGTPGGLASSAAPAVPPCSAFIIGAPTNAWSDWFAYTFGSPGVAATAWA